MLTWLVVGLLVSACASVWLAFELNGRYRTEVDQLHRAGDAINHLQLLSHQRSMAVRSYVSTTEEAYYRNYQALRASANDFDKVVQGFVIQRMPESQVMQVLEARDKSALMAEYELQAFALAREGDWKPAIERVFGQDYQQASLAALEPLRSIEQALHERGRVQVNQVERQARIAMYFAVLLTLGGLLLVALVLRSFYHRRVLKPLVDMTAATDHLLHGQLDIHYRHAEEQSEIGDLSRALCRYRDAMQELDCQRRQFSEAEAWYRQIIEFAPDGMLVVDEAGTILIANPKVHEQFGYVHGAMLGLCVDDLVPLNVRPVHAQMRAKFMDSNRSRAMGSISGDFRAVDRQGREFPVELGLTRLPLIEGRSPCACVTIRDISERKRLDQQISDQLAFQRVLLDTLPYPVFVKDADMRYIDFNQSFLDTFGVRREDLLGRTVLQFAALPAEDIPRYQEANQKVIREGGSHVAEVRIPLSDGQLHPAIYCLSGYKGSDGRTAGLVGTLIDISAQKQAELDQAHAKELAEEATRLKSDFLANMSHEIRTPMNVIMGMAHLALDSGLEGRQRSYVEKIQTAAQGLLGIINDILDFSKIEAGRMHFEQVDFFLEDVLSGLVDQATLKAQEKGLELLFDIATSVPTGLVGDPLRLGQVLNNLLSNALKFTERGEVTLCIRPEQESDGKVWLYFEVQDTGIGMSAEQISRLFRAFTQADSSTSRKYGGTGLGLTICQRLVQLMGGDIGVDSEPGIGSSFYFRAPFGLQKEQRQLIIGMDDLLGMPVLVVDDNATAREILTSMLTSLRFQVDNAASAVQAIDKLEQAHAAGKPFRLVLMDWMMPGVDGIEALRRIRSDEQIADTPLFIMVTAYSRDELRECLGELEVQDVLVKPVTPSTLLDSILNAFGREALARPRRREVAQEVEWAQRQLSGAYLLLVEDNLVNQEMTVEILGRAGIRVDVASNGAQALAMVVQRAYDGVLMDCQMPVMDGFEATQRIRQLPGMAQLPILAMTANAMAGDRQRCLDAGMNEHIAKPLDVGQLFITLSRWIKGHGAQPPVVVPEPDPLVPVIEGLELESALQRLAGDSALLRRLLERFCDSEQGSIARVRQALLAGERGEAERLVHSLKGLAGNVGARELAQRAGDLESMLRHKREGFEFETLLARVEQDLRRLVDSIRAGLRSADAEPAGPRQQPAGEMDSATLAACLDRLETLLRKDDGESMQVLEPVLPSLEALGCGHEASILAELIGRYAYEEALDGLASLRQSLSAGKGA
ncbi:response regulator [Aquipseudomonas alcaligenes]|uniref:response regulator n=1 Tax=Aquipseudomonas alcaligenes TaxID=43263 RepID=UPI00111585C0|nr:response regulator [Pseudomonas alcaligenes]